MNEDTLYDVMKSDKRANRRKRSEKARAQREIIRNKKEREYERGYKGVK